MGAPSRKRRGWSTTDWFDVPRYYDMVYSPGTRREVAFAVSLADWHGRGSTSWLEPACGTGRVVAELARRGCEVTGYDINDHTLAYARRRMKRRGLQARLVQARMESFRTPRTFDAAYCGVNSVRYLLDEDDVLSHLHATAAVLKPGGVYLVGLHLTDYDRGTRDMERWVVRRGSAEVTAVTLGWPPDRRTRLQQLRTRLRVATPSGERRYETVWTYRTYDLPEWMRLLDKTPFRAVAVYDFNYTEDMKQTLQTAQDDSLFVLRAP